MAQLGSAVIEIKKEFFALDEDDRDELFAEYGVEYGNSAEAYARNTFHNWRSGSTALSGQTMERLIQLVPPYLSTAKRFRLLEIIVNRHKIDTCSNSTKVVRINAEDPSPSIDQINIYLSSMKLTENLAPIPEYIMKAANWLYADDITVARSMLSEAESCRNEIIKASAVRDLQLIIDGIWSGQIKTATYKLNAPSGDLKIQIYTPRKSLWQKLFK